ncbi:MAG: hypothetical protein AAF741_00200 [Bacteroidota bacterium]
MTPYYTCILCLPLLALFNGNDKYMTHQIENLIVIGEDTLYAGKYFYSESSIHDFIEENRVVPYDSEIDCEPSSCYREYFVIWQLFGRKLYLKEIVNCCTGESIDMRFIFGKKYRSEMGILAKFINGNFPISDTSEIIILLTRQFNQIDIHFRKGKLNRKDLSKLEKYLLRIKNS